MDDIQSEVGRIALIMAAKRAIETDRPDRLFTDPWAHRLAGTELPTLKARWHHQYGDQYEHESQIRSRFVAVRTRFFDDFLMGLNGTCPQVVILGAGLDTRAFRLPWATGTQVYEIEQPQVMQYKNTLLQDTVAQCDRHPIAINLQHNWVPLLLGQGYQASTPSLWLMEGLLMYLSVAAVHPLLQNIATLSAPGSWLGADLISTQSLHVGLAQGDRVRKYWQFGTDDPVQLLAPYGWRVSLTQPGAPNASFGRYTRQPLPLEVPAVRRSFLITAQKP